MTWWDRDHVRSDGELYIDGTHAALRGPGAFEFELSDVEVVVVTPHPTAVHARILGRGWLVMTPSGSRAACELASVLSQPSEP